MNQPKDLSAGAGEIQPKFEVRQVVMVTSLKKPMPFVILERILDGGEWFYRWNKKNAAAEHMLRALTPDEAGLPEPRKRYVESGEQRVKDALAKASRDTRDLRTEENGGICPDCNREKTYCVCNQKYDKRVSAEAVSVGATKRFSSSEIDEICCEWGGPEYVITDDGEAWYWRFPQHDLPVADNLSELFNAAQQLERRKERADFARKNRTAWPNNAGISAVSVGGEDAPKLSYEVRKQLWLTHGCGIECLYGDDGEMQCGRFTPFIDFKRFSEAQILEGIEIHDARRADQIIRGESHDETR